MLYILTGLLQSNNAIACLGRYLTTYLISVFNTPKYLEMREMYFARLILKY